MTFEELSGLIRDWAQARGIYEHSSATAQLLKGVSELGELADAEVKHDYAGKVDAVGDVIVCLINYCAMSGLDPVQCLHSAYDQIKDRKGRMVPGGAFVKDD